MRTMQEGIEKIEWRNIPGFEGQYQVSRCGKIKRLAAIDSSIERLKEDYILSASPVMGFDYSRVALNSKRGARTFAVHRLVALAFIPNPERKPLVNHKDRDRTNNHADNLEWCTQKENMQHAARMDKMHLLSMEVGRQVRIVGTENVGTITSVESGWVFINPSPEPYPNNFWHYKNLQLIKE